MRVVLGVAVVLLIVLSVPAVTAQDEAGTNTLEFRANGEDFVRQGFVSKDDWRIDFDHVYVSLSGIRAFQTDPPYDPFAGELITGNQMVGLAGEFTIDLAEGDAEAEPILIESYADAPVGYYNAVTWMMLPASEGDIEGYTVVMDGVAQKDGETVEFVIQVDEIYIYNCGAFIGDERKGILTEDETGEVELTFHFDHIFGDAELPEDDSLNMTAPGFEPFAAAATDGVLEMNMDDLADAMPAEAFEMFVDILPSLGHVGEGHCHES